MATRPAFRSPRILPTLCRMGVVVGFAISTWGCASAKPKLQLVQDPSFNPAVLRQSQIAVAGVTSRLGSVIDRATVRNQFAGILAGALEFQLSGLRVMPVDVARSRLGQVRHAQLLADLENAGRVSVAAIAQLDSAIGAVVRYAVVARIDSELVKREESTTTPVILPGEDYHEGDPQRSTRRSLDVSFLVYELSGGRVVWEELVRGSDIATATGSWTEKKTTYPAYPKAPKLRWAFDDACRTLASHLAKPPK